MISAIKAIHDKLLHIDAFAQWWINNELSLHYFECVIASGQAEFPKQDADR